MARNNYRVGVPKDVKIPEEQVIPPAEDVSTKTQSAVIKISNAPMKLPPIKSEVLYQVRVNHPSLRKRNGPTTASAVVGLITDKGIYDIYKESSGWGQLQDHSWIMLQYCTKVK